MRLRATTVLAVAMLLLATTVSWASLVPYNQDFEGLVQADPVALANDGWLVFGNVFFDASKTIYDYGYGPFPAPNGGPAFSAIANGEGGVPQGAQQLSIYNDYNNPDHGNGKWIEANVFQEWMIETADVGGTWKFEFDAKLGNLTGGSTALAFIKTLDPGNGFATTNFITADMTTTPGTWTGYSLSLPIDASLDGQILQIGFASTATAFEGSGVFYDNLNWGLMPPVPGASPVAIAAIALLVASMGMVAVRRRSAQA